ncbi:MAG TPA: hypothetical protein VGD42_11585, partial [Lysobacter sp.]
GLGWILKTLSFWLLFSLGQQRKSDPAGFRRTEALVVAVAPDRRPVKRETSLDSRLRGNDGEVVLLVRECPSAVGLGPGLRRDDGGGGLRMWECPHAIGLGPGSSTSSGQAFAWMTIQGNG